MHVWTRALCLLALALATPSIAGTAAYEQVFKTNSDQVARSIQVVRLSDGKVLFEKDPNRLLSPASVTKVLTSAVVLSKLTPAFKFVTDFYVTKKGKTYQDLYVVGGGDPYLVSEQLWQVAADLRHIGVTEFQGDLVLDNSLFGDGFRDDSRKDGAKKSRHAYDAPVSALAVNFNTYAIAITPGANPGDLARMSLDPYNLPHVSLVNKVKTVSSTAKPPLITIKRTVTSTGESLIAEGEIAVSSPVQKIYRSVADPVLASGSLIQAFFKHEGITFKGKIKQGVRPDVAVPLLSLESYELRRIVQGLNVFSNNFIADSLIKRLGALYPEEGESDTPGSGTLEAGMKVLKDYLTTDVGIKSSFVLENASGLSPQNRLSAEQVVRVLSKIEKEMEIFPEFLGSLPAIGWDGTLKKRFKKDGRSDLQGLIRAKTGTLTEPISVSSIAGYFRHPKHGLVAFCIIENGVEGKKQPGVGDLKEGQDKALASLVTELP